MKNSKRDFYSPLVVGAPRTGFTLLITIARNLYRFAGPKRDNKLELLTFIVNTLGEHLYRSILNTFAAEGISDDLVFNAMFHPLIGGPKWINASDTRYACFRKYIGVRDMGDFTLISKHPRQLMDCDNVVHSHANPALWLELPEYDTHTKFAAVRNPCGALNSAVFSINATTSEYIQKFLPPEEDNDLIRQHVAKYKLTNLDFFEGLVNFYSQYLREFTDCHQYFIIMRWEDLILKPVDTILQLSSEAGISLTEKQASDIWGQMSYRNLTGPHHHNFRKGKGKVGDWENSLLNEHLEIIKGSGLEYFTSEFGYEPIQYIEELNYTPFQREILGYIRRGQVFEDYPDRNLFVFDFQKSNIKWDGLLEFKTYPWRKWTQIERSCLSNEGLVEKVSDAAEEAIERVNAVICDFLEGDYNNTHQIQTSLQTLQQKHGPMLQNLEKGRYKKVLKDAASIAPDAEEPLNTKKPVMVRTKPTWNPNLKIDFVKSDLGTIISSVRGYLKQGGKNFLLRTFNAQAANLVKTFEKDAEDPHFFVRENESEIPLPKVIQKVEDETEIHVTLIMTENVDQLSNILHECINMSQGTILAPITKRYCQKNPLFVVSIPKGGTHLLFELVRAIGYTDGLVLTDPPKKGFWYFLEYSNAHTSARDFFIDTIRRASFGNRQHPFPTSPTIFIYRNPLDIIVSEAFYYHQEGNTAFYGYLSELSLEERILRLIDDPWLLGSIRSRIGNFIAWLDFPNVIPVSYEELVGKKGGGDDEILEKLIWSLQLKLQVPGVPSQISEKIYNEKSPTFRKGHIGSHRKHFTPEAYSHFCKLPQDFMKLLGYEVNSKTPDFVLPKRSEEFRKRRLKLGDKYHDDIPIVIEYDFFGRDIIVYKGVYYAQPRSISMLDFENATKERLEKFLNAGDLTSIKSKIVKELNAGNILAEPKKAFKWAKSGIFPVSFFQKAKNQLFKGFLNHD